MFISFFHILSSVGFRTTPMDSTGVPHILEHTVLCGSHRFPCRDPFFNMLNRSLATFMNAFTGKKILCTSPNEFEIMALFIYIIKAWGSKHLLNKTFKTLELYN